MRLQNEDIIYELKMRLDTAKSVSEKVKIKQLIDLINKL
jgi:hypothetical protein